jgi:hypothetical protein
MILIMIYSLNGGKEESEGGEREGKKNDHQGGGRGRRSFETVLADN